MRSTKKVYAKIPPEAFKDPKKLRETSLEIAKRLHEEKCMYPYGRDSGRPPRIRHVT